MADRLREDELYGHGRRGRMFRGEREEESGYAYGRGFGEPGETYERAFEGPGYAYGRGYGGPDAAPVTTDGPLPETSDLVAGWYMIDVDSYERAVELAAYVSSEPGPGGEPLYEWIDVREVMSDAPSDD